MSMSRTIDFSGHSIRFGVADSDLQVIGETEAIANEHSQATMWSAFARAKQLREPNIGSRRYERWEEDAERMARLGIKHYRTSVSWSRVMTADDEPNELAIRWYQNYFKALASRGISIYATLYHWELPQAVSQAGGWRNRKTLDRFIKHCSIVEEALGNNIEEYFVLNEPSCAALFGYHRGIHAPGETSLRGGLEAAHNLLLAQGIAIQELVSRGRKVSTVVNIQPAYAESASAEDLVARNIADCYWNRWFLDPLFVGEYPQDMVERYGSLMPSHSSEDMKIIRAGALLNSLGLNYYNGEIVRADASTELGFARCDHGKPTNDLGWPIFVPPHYPSGLHDALREVFHRYQQFGLRSLYITETGLAKAPNSVDPMNDPARIQFIKDHLAQGEAAICSGVPLDALFVWSFCDSYEWQDGHRPESHFGLIHVDPHSGARTEKASARWYSDFLKSRRISA
jgi:beta-glucosidase